jgi:uncharacterized protein YbcC (UPF0753/DUF2309 family)
VSHYGSYLLFLGHGHNSYINPHVAAYRCGACSGSNAAPNARMFAKAANDPQIREILKEKHGLDLPTNTYVIGGFHDTCSDEVELFDIDQERISENDKEEINKILVNARQRNAKERCAKFYQTSKDLSVEEALRHVEQRAWRVAEPRPELNHATNTLCIVGKRDLTRNVFLDRKAFLVSYDQKIDHDGKILAGLLAAAIPVCSGINLEYYFSKTDTENYGSGSKTSHNVTGLIGVANGVRGDLRTGLVWQMVEYHDPLRILFIIETTPEALEKVKDNNAEVKNIVDNDWVVMAIGNPEDSEDIKVYKNGEYQSFEALDIKVESFAQSIEVPTGLDHPVHVAYIGGR